VVRLIRIYVEGGGGGRSSWRPLRAGFQKFLNPLRRQQIQVILGGSKSETFKDFKRGLEQHPDAFNILLVDSDEVVALPRWEHLRRQDRWDIPNYPEEQCHLMVQATEAWLVADPDALAKYYGKGFRHPKHDDVEALTKDQLFRSLALATKATKKEKYAKSHCADLLSLLNQDRVRQRAHHCDLLFRTLESRIRE